MRLERFITVNELVSVEGVVYVAVEPSIEALASLSVNATCIGCAFHSEKSPSKPTKGCLEAPNCDGEVRYDGRTIHWEVKK